MGRAFGNLETISVMILTEFGQQVAAGNSGKEERRPELGGLLLRLGVSQKGAKAWLPH